MNMNKIYIGNLPYQTNEKELENLFSKYGQIEDVAVIRDRYTNRSKGFGFVTFSTSEAAQNALEVNGQDLQGRALKVNIAMERKERPRREQ